jgi:hypothetical protein
MVIPFERGRMTIRARERGAVGWPTMNRQSMTRHAGGIGTGLGFAHGISLPNLFIYSPRNSFMNKGVEIVAHSQFIYAHNYTHISA